MGRSAGTWRCNELRTGTPEDTRGRVDPRDARGRGGVRATRAALQRWQGLDRHAAPRHQGLLARAGAVPGHARRHRPQLRRGLRVPRQHRRAPRVAPRRGVGPGVDRQGPGGGAVGPAGEPQPVADHDPAGRHRGARVRRSLRGCAPRRGAGPSEGALLFLPRRVRPVGPQEPASRAVEPLQRPPPPGRAHPRLPAQQLDRTRHLAVHRGGGHRGAPHLLRPRARGVPARRYVAGRHPVREPRR